MANLTGDVRAKYVREMFTDIAPRYDLMNRLMTLGQDGAWRREAIWRLQLPATGRLLDLGSGTGDLAREALHQVPGCQPIAADFTPTMMLIGKRRSSRDAARQIGWTNADALRLPFLDETFVGVVSGFLMRNVIDLPTALQEQYRILVPGGRIVILDTTPPAPSPISPLIRLHLKYVIPTLGRLLAGNVAAYTYLPDTTVNFLPAEALAEQMQITGFEQVGFRRRMLGTIAIHWGNK